MNLLPVWSPEQIAEDCASAKDWFRQSRLLEPLHIYSESFEDFSGEVDDLLEQTLDLVELRKELKKLLVSKKSRHALRYLTAPPISEDDLKVVADISTFSTKNLDDETIDRIATLIVNSIDRRRFEWISLNADPTEDQRRTAVIASAAIYASRKVETWRRNQGKREQEESVRTTLVDAGLQEVSRRRIIEIDDYPAKGEFCLESSLMGHRADFVVRLFDGRVLPIECKVSNSTVNSFKRLNHDTVAKASAWAADSGKKLVFPAAVLAGVFAPANVIEAQSRNVSIFWAHRLETLKEFVVSSR